MKWSVDSRSTRRVVPAMVEPLESRALMAVATVGDLAVRSRRRRGGRRDRRRGPPGRLPAAVRGDRRRPSAGRRHGRPRLQRRRPGGRPLRRGAIGRPGGRGGGGRYDRRGRRRGERPGRPRPRRRAAEPRRHARHVPLAATAGSSCRSTSAVTETTGPPGSRSCRTGRSSWRPPRRPTAGDDYGLAKLRPDGTLDPSFGDGGCTTIDFGQAVRGRPGRRARGDRWRPARGRRHGGGLGRRPRPLRGGGRRGRRVAGPVLRQRRDCDGRGLRADRPARPGGRPRRPARAGGRPRGDASRPRHGRRPPGRRAAEGRRDARPVVRRWRPGHRHFERRPRPLE